MTKFVNTTTFTANNTTTSLVWSNTRKAEAMAHIEALGGTILETTKMHKKEFPCIKANTTDTQFFAEDEAIMVNAQGGKSVWICFTEDAAQFAADMEALAA